MNRPHHPALVCEGPGEWSVAEWAHARDERRVLGQDWPFGDGPGRWTVPAPAYHSAQEHRAERYAAQATYYARGIHPDLVLVDDIAPEDESIGTELHEVAESMAQRDIYYRPLPSVRLGDQLEDAQHLYSWRHGCRPLRAGEES